MVKEKLIKSIVRYLMVGISASLTTWLISKGADPTDVAELIEILKALAPALLTVIWSFLKNTGEAGEVENLHKEIKTLKKKVEYNESS